MRVLFDISCLDHERISGVGTYARHLGYALGQLKDLDVVGSYRISRRRKLEIMRRHWVGPTLAFVPLWSSWATKGFSLIHGPDFKVPQVRHMARVVTIHDLAFYDEGYSHLLFSEQRRRHLDRLLNHQTPEAIIAVSRFTKEEIVRRFPHVEDRIKVVWHGADHLLRPSYKGLRPLKEPYFLFVGNLEVRKNVKGLIQAFDILKSQPQHRDTRLVLVGKAGFGFNEIFQTAKNSPSREHILFPGFISNMGLVNYYQWAEAFVYPSLYEGFGFPILESMRLGCPVITSPITATAEVAGDAALLADPREPEAIAAAMNRLIEDQSLRAQLIEAGQRRGQEFTWSRCALETRAVYKFAQS